MGFFTGSKPKIVTKDVVDPTKQAVASPLSDFLASRVGQGLPRYQGEIAAPMDEATMSRYGEYLGTDPTTFFQEKVTRPTMQTAREELLPEVREGYAGSLRGSGRYRGEEEFVSNVSQKLGVEAARFVPSMYESQIKAGMSMQQIRDVKVQREYQDWYKSLPEMNPVLDKAMGFLSSQVSSGTTTLSALDPGTKGAFWDLLETGAKAAATAGTIAMMASSRYVKDDITPNKIDSIGVIESLDIVNFRYKPEAKIDVRNRIGVIAEDSPDIIATENHDGIDMVNTIGILLDAVQRLNKRVIELEEVT